MALDLSRFLTLPLAVQPVTSDFDFNKPATQRPRSMRVLIDWNVEDARYIAVRPATTDPYSLSFDLAQNTVNTINELKTAVIDNTNNGYPVLLECTDSGFQIRVEPGEFRITPLITTNTLFKLWSLYGTGGVSTGGNRRTDLYFTNVNMPPFSAAQPRQQIPFGYELPPAETTHIVIPKQASSYILSSIRVTDYLASSGASTNFSLLLQIRNGAQLQTLYQGTLNTNSNGGIPLATLYEANNSRIAFPAGSELIATRGQNGFGGSHNVSISGLLSL